VLARLVDARMVETAWDFGGMNKLYLAADPLLPGDLLTKG
jgi:hypothetical protein